MMHAAYPPLICLMGPTASGKTALACELVEYFPLEIISVDSAMIYRGMDIGTAKPDAATLVRAPHHLIDILDPTESYSVARFCEDIAQLSRAIFQRGKIPLLVGGTMMYFRALQQGLSSLPQADESTRQQLSQEAAEHGWQVMHEKLHAIDPISAAKIHCHDTQRIQRALEVYRVAGQPLSTLLAKQARPPYRLLNLILLPEDRTWLHQRIADRFEQMLKLGLVEEVESLLQQWSLTLAHPALRTVGYRQVYTFLQGAYPTTELYAQGVAATRQVAKRQITWLRQWPKAQLFSAENLPSYREIIAIIAQLLDNADIDSCGRNHV